MPSAAFTGLVWELLLDFFLLNPNSRFSAARFDRWIIQKVDGNSIPVTDTLKTALAAAARAKPPPEKISYRQETPPQAIVSKKEARKVFKGYDLYEALRFYLMHGVVPWSAGILAPDIRIAKIIDELCGSYPEKLLKFANDLRYEPDLCQGLAEKLNPALIKQILTALAAACTPQNDNDRSALIQSIIEYADRASDSQGYYADIFHNLVTRRPHVPAQIAARHREPKKTAPEDVLMASGQDPDLIRANLAALLNTGKKTTDRSATFSRLLDELETKFPSHYRDFLAWLAANKKRFTAFIKLSSPQNCNKSLAYLATAPSLHSRAIEALEALPARFDKRAVPDKGLVEVSSPSQSDMGPMPAEQNIEDESALLGYLTGEQSSRLISNTTASVIFKQRIRQGSDTLVASLRDHLKHRNVRKKMIRLLTENWLTRVLVGLRPDLYLPVQRYADAIADACYSKELFDRPEKINAVKWDFIFTYLAQAENRPFHQGDFIRRFIAFLAGHIRPGARETFTAVLSRNLTDSITSSTRPENLAVLEELGHPGDVAEDFKPTPLAHRRVTAGETLEDVVVENAGLVVAAPYLPKLWNMFDLTGGGKFKGFQEAERAVHLLQFMTNGNTTSLEYQLVLNKILCGINLRLPITTRIDITATEQEAIEGLIQAMIDNWKTIGRASVEGFRESFFQRRGRLTLRDDGWHLKVVPRAFDMLLDSIPWGFATIKYPWMDRMLYVKWR
jgi:hypothetical protein